MKTARHFIVATLMVTLFASWVPFGEKKAHALPGVKCAILFLAAPIELLDAYEAIENAEKVCKANGAGSGACIKAVGFALIALAKAALTNLELYCECLGGANLTPKLCALIGIIPNEHGGANAPPVPPALPKADKPLIK